MPVYKTYNCICCGKLNERKANTMGKFCNNKCQQVFHYKKRLTEWKETGNISKHTLKKFLSDKKEGCWECGIVDWNGKDIVLELEHIDGDSTNNSEENVSLLCPNCHSQTDTYKNKNKGNGRHYRRVRYQERKSY